MLKIITFTLLFNLILLGFSVSFPETTSFRETSSEPKKDYRGWIELEQDSTYLIVKGMFENRSEKDVSVTYRLIMEKTGESGSSTSRQSGEMEVPAGEKKIFSRVKMNLQPADEYTITLKIFKDDKLIIKDVVSYPQVRKI